MVETPIDSKTFLRDWYRQTVDRVKAMELAARLRRHSEPQMDMGVSMREAIVKYGMEVYWRPTVGR